MRTTPRAVLLLLISAIFTVLMLPGAAKAATLAPQAPAAVRIEATAAVTVRPAGPDAHQRHLRHLAHLADVRHRDHATLTAVTSTPRSSVYAASGVYSFGQLEQLWQWAGGPSWAAWDAASIAECESGGSQAAYNSSSGASGIWQILGAPENWTGSTDWFSPQVNALAAVDKFEQAGDTFGPWVCQPLAV